MGTYSSRIEGVREGLDFQVAQRIDYPEERHGPLLSHPRWALLFVAFRYGAAGAGRFTAA
jgi:hypothetical protein